MKKNLFSTLLALLTIGAMLTCVGCKNYDDDISDINKKIASVESELSTLQASLTSTTSSLQSAIDALKAEVAKCANEEDLALLEAQIVALAASVDEAKETLEANDELLNKKIDDQAATAARTYATIEELSKAQTAISNLETQVNTLSGKYDELVKAAESAHQDIKAELAKIDEKIKTAIEAALTNYYTKDEIQDLFAILEGTNFSIKAIATKVDAAYYTYKWYAPESTTKKGWVQKIAAVYPEIAEYKAGDLVSFGTTLPFFAAPSGVDMTEFNFALVDVYGFDYGVTFKVPYEGIVEGEWCDGCNDHYITGYTTKAGNENAWSVELSSPLYDDKGAAIYNDNDSKDHLALVAKNGDVTAQTSFAYSITSTKSDTKNFIVAANSNITAEYNAQGIDIEETGLFSVSENGAPLLACVYEAADSKAQIERLAIKIDGSVLTLNDFEEASVPVKITITAIGMNGVPAQITGILTVTQPQAEYEFVFSDNEATLALGSNGQPNDDVLMKWNVSELGMTVSELSDFMQAITLAKEEFTIIVKNSDGKDVSDYANDAMTATRFLKKDGTAIYPKANWTNEDFDKAAEEAVYFAFGVKSSKAVPDTYSITASIQKVGYANMKFTTNVTIKNPEADQIKVIDALVEEGVLQLVGAPNVTTITYDLQNAFVTADGYTSVNNNTAFVDYDWYSAEFPTEVPNWVSNEQTLFIPIWDSADKIATSTDPKTSADFPKGSKLLYTPRNIVVAYGAFNNKYNLRYISFKAQFVSPIVDKDGKSNVTVNDAVELVFSDKDKREIEINTIVKEAKYVAQVTYKKSAYDVFSTLTNKGTGKTDIYSYNYDENNISTSTKEQISGTSSWANGKLVKDNDGEFIEITGCASNILRGFGMNDDEVLALQALDIVYLTEDMLNFSYNGETSVKGWHFYKNDINGDDNMSTYKPDDTYWTFSDNVKESIKYYTSYSSQVLNWISNNYQNWYATKDGKGLLDALNAEIKTQKWNVIADADAKQVASYEYVKECFKHKTDEEPATTNWVSSGRATEINSTSVVFDDEAYAAKFVTPTLVSNPYEVTDSKEEPVHKFKYNPSYSAADLVSPVTLTGKLKIKDNWGMTSATAFKIVCKNN